MAEVFIIDPPGPEPKLSENALVVLKSRYLLKDEHGRCIETPGQLLSRVARFVAGAEDRYGASATEINHWHKRFYELIASLRFLPNSPALMNANRPQAMLSACFVLPIEDSIEGIFETIKHAALIQKAGGGTGFSFDRLRPTGDRVASSGGTTSGPISFWRVFCEATNAIQQGAYRRGANMGIMGIEHPDILKFLYAKQNLAAFTNFNVSVKVTDDWMRTLAKSPSRFAVVRNPRTSQRYLLPRKLDIDSYTINDLHRISGRSTPRKGPFYTVRDLWKMIVRCAHKTAEPGLVFIDRINSDNPTPSLGQIEATNPCGEQPLLAFEACTLGSINLAKFVIGNDPGRINWHGLGEAVSLAVRFLDNIIDVCDYPVTETTRISQANRKIGLGVMGFADCLFKLRIPYDSRHGVDFGTKLMKFVNDKSHAASSRLAELRGPFPNWPDSTWRSEKSKKVRNAAVTCVAPTGTISIIADCSCGIEPVYSLVFLRRVLTSRELLQINPVFKQMVGEKGLYTKKIQNRIAKTGSIQRISEIPPGMRRVFKAAFDITPTWHVKMQAAFQRNCDAAVSKTINFPENATPAAVEKAYKLAYELGCKGITIYRRRSRPCEPMTLY